jgi:hypothetical protein
MGEIRLKALQARVWDLNAAAATREARTGLDQPGLLPEGLRNSLMIQQRWVRHGYGAPGMSTMILTGRGSIPKSLVVELRRDANPETVLAELHRRTALQSNYGAILLALVHGKPIQLTLRQLLQEFLDYRELTLIRRTRHALKRAEDRLEVVEGLITALNALARVIEMITAAPDAASAKASLQVHLDLNERQADAVLAMPLRWLTGHRAGAEQPAQGGGGPAPGTGPAAAPAG